MNTKSITLRPATLGALALAIFSALFLLLGFTQSAYAESPTGCNAVNLQQSPLVNPAGFVYDGDTLSYSVSYTNLDPDGAGPSLPCDITDANASITLPDSTVINVLVNVDLPLGTTISCPGDAECAAGPYEYVVDDNDEVNGAVTTDFDIAGDRQGSTITVASDEDSIPTEVIHPSTDVSADLDLNTVVDGNDVTLTVTESNDGDIDLTNVYIEVSPLGLSLDETDTEFSGTDVGGDGVLSPSETWEWTITDTPAGDTTYTVVGHGEDPNANDVTWTEGCEVQDPEPGVICDPNEEAQDSVRVVQGLEIEKTVNETFDRDWDWDIDKRVATTSLLFAEGQSYTVDYEVEVTPTSDDINHSVSGDITIANPSGNPTATIEAVNDVLDTTGPISVDCGVTFPYDLAGGDDLVCSYNASSSPDDTLNTAAVVTSGVIPGATTTEDVSFEEGDLNNETDECVIVNDTNSEFPGPDVEICEDDADKTIEYSITFGPDQEGTDVVLECGITEYPNTADFITNDNQETGDDDATVTIEVTCEVGCTLTQGYWKTHSASGPAPYDDNWQNIFETIYDDGDANNEEEEEIFYESEMTWLDVFWTPPKGGNSYYQLAHQYMAAVLNTLNEASAPTEVEDAISDAHDLFGMYAPEDLVTYAVNKKGKTIGKKMSYDAETLDEMKDLAGVLASYNEGEIGPGHCDEDESSQVD